MLNHYVAALASTYTEMFSEGLDDSDCLDNTSIVKYAENENYVSYFITHDLYLGGAHGSQMYSGATFRKADGRRIGWGNVRPSTTIISPTCSRTVSSSTGRSTPTTSSSHTSSMRMTTIQYLFPSAPPCSPLTA